MLPNGCTSAKIVTTSWPVARPIFAILLGYDLGAIMSAISGKDEMKSELSWLDSQFRFSFLKTAIFSALRFYGQNYNYR